MCFECSKEPSHRDGSIEYPQHMFWLRNKKINFQLRTLIWGPALLIMKTGNKFLALSKSRLGESSLQFCTIQLAPFIFQGVIS